MTLIKEEKVKIFAKVYINTTDVVEAARAISKTTDPKMLRTLGNKYLSMPEVQDAIEKASTFVLDRDGIARALTEILTGTATADQKIKAAAALERVTRYGDKDEGEGFQDDFERFLYDYGDILEEFMKGKPDNFEKVFRPRLSADGKVTFHVKKNLSHLEKKQAMIILLRTLISRNAFSSSS